MTYIIHIAGIGEVCRTTVRSIADQAFDSSVTNGEGRAVVMLLDGLTERVYLATKKDVFTK